MNIIQSNIANLPTKYGKFKIKAYKDGHQEHLAIMSQDFENIDAPFVRIHSECLTGDTRTLVNRYDKRILQTKG